MARGSELFMQLESDHISEDNVVAVNDTKEVETNTPKRSYTCGECMSCVEPTLQQKLTESNKQPSKIKTNCNDNEMCKTPRQDVNGNFNSEIKPQDYSKHDSTVKDKSVKHINELPSSIIIKILSHLPLNDRVINASLVSSYWHQLCFDSELWREIDLSGIKKVTDDVLWKAVSYSNNVTYLDISDCCQENLTDEGLRKVLKKCKNLEFLNVTRAGTERYTDRAFLTFPDDCPNIVTMKLDCLHITNHTLFGLAAHSVHLEYLSLRQINTVTDKALKSIVNCCRKLKVLRLTQNQQITGEFFSAFSESDFTLEHLDVMMTGVTEDKVPMLGCLKNLQNLNLSQCRSLQFQHLYPVLQTCKKIDTLSLNLVENLDDSWVESIVKMLPKLMQLFLISTAITDKALEHMANYAHNLQNIDVGYTKVSHRGVKVLAEKCKLMKIVGLIRCPNVDEEVIEELVQTYSYIRFSTFLQDTKRILEDAGQWNFPPDIFKMASKSSHPYYEQTG